MDFKREIKEILKENGKTAKWLSDELKLDYSYVRKMTQNKGYKTSSWVRSFVLAYKLKNSKDE